MDRPARVKIAQERDWVTPQSPLWFCFEAAVYKLLVEWDVSKSNHLICHAYDVCYEASVFGVEDIFLMSSALRLEQ